jgi:thymidylate synthase (FAD)
MKQFPVLDHGYVMLVDSMGTDLSVVNAARASFGKRSTYLSESDIKLINYLASHGHTSPFRHATLTFEIKAPIMVARQWFKYRVGSVHSDDTSAWFGAGDESSDDPLYGRNEASRRYVTMAPEFYVPSYLRTQSADKKQGSSKEPHPESYAFVNAMSQIFSTLNAMYHDMLMRGVAPEQARLILPGYALYTSWHWTCSLQGLIHFLKQRLGSDAQDEITQYARACHVIAEPLFAESFKAFGLHNEKPPA